MKVLYKILGISIIYLFLLQACSHNVEPEEEVITLSVPSFVDFSNKGGSRSITVLEGAYKVPPEWEAVIEVGDYWCTISKNGLTITVQAAENPYPSLRQARIKVSAPSGCSAIMFVNQEGTGVVTDGKYYPYLTSTKGKGVDIVIMGEGFTEAVIRNGEYFDAMERAAEAFLGTQPFKAYRDYFNIYFLEAVSQESGISDLLNKKNTKFKVSTSYSEARPYLYGDLDFCWSFSGNAPVKNIDSALVVVILNDRRWIGSSWWRNTGRVVSLCSIPQFSYPYDFSSIVRRCAGGQGFGRLASENDNIYPMLTEAARADILWYQSTGCYLNIDVTNDPTKILWKDFLWKPKYNMVGIFEGAYYYERGVWRSEFESCMYNDIAYFNAISRAIIVQRILMYAGQPFSLEKFMEMDIIEPPPPTKSNFVPPLALRLPGPAMWINEEKE